MAWSVSRRLGQSPDGLKSLQTTWKDSRWPGKFPYSLESFHLDWTVSSRPWKFPDCLESFRIAWKVSRLPEKFPDGLDSLQTAWKVSRPSGKFPDGLESFQMTWKISRLFWKVCIFPKSGLFNPKKTTGLQKLSRFTKTFQVALLPCYPGFSASTTTITTLTTGHHHNTVKYAALCEADPKFRWPEPTRPTTQPFTPSSGGYADEAWRELDWAVGLGAWKKHWISKFCSGKNTLFWGETFD